MTADRVRRPCRVAPAGFGTVGRPVARPLQRMPVDVGLVAILNRRVADRRVDWVDARVRWTGSIDEAPNGILREPDFPDRAARSSSVSTARCRMGSRRRSRRSTPSTPCDATAGEDARAGGRDPRGDRETVPPGSTLTPACCWK
ncbi:MAG TPA: hypothetical protein VF921_05770 [Vicinamibacterales bacterium]